MHISAIFKKGFYWRLCTDKLTRLTLYNKGRRSILSIHVLFVYGIIRSTSRARERRRGGGHKRRSMPIHSRGCWSRLRGRLLLLLLRHPHQQQQRQQQREGRRNSWEERLLVVVGRQLQQQQDLPSVQHCISNIIIYSSRCKLWNNQVYSSSQSIIFLHQVWKIFSFLYSALRQPHATASSAMILPIVIFYICNKMYNIIYFYIISKN